MLSHPILHHHPLYLPCDPVVVPTEADSLSTSYLLHIVHVVCGEGGMG